MGTMPAYHPSVLGSGVFTTLRFDPSCESGSDVGAERRGGGRALGSPGPGSKGEYGGAVARRRQTDKVRPPLTRHPSRCPATHACTCFLSVTKVRHVVRNFGPKREFSGFIGPGGTLWVRGEGAGQKYSHRRVVGLVNAEGGMQLGPVDVCSMLDTSGMKLRARWYFFHEALILSLSFSVSFSLIRSVCFPCISLPLLLVHINTDTVVRSKPSPSPDLLPPSPTPPRTPRQPHPYPRPFRTLASVCVTPSCRRYSISEPLGCLISSTSGVTSSRRLQPSGDLSLNPGTKVSRGGPQAHARGVPPCGRHCSWTKSAGRVPCVSRGVGCVTLFRVA